MRLRDKERNTGCRQ